MDGYALLFVRETYVPLLKAALDLPHVAVTTRFDFLTTIAKRRPMVAYVDRELLPQIEGETSGIPIVGILEGGLETVIPTLQAIPWISHLVSATMLASPTARANLVRLHERLVHGPEYHVLGAAGAGRVALLAASERREARLERMREFFANQNVQRKSIAVMSDVAEELMTNALYDAPLEAGYFKQPISRTAGVELPPEHACEISYGIDDRCCFVRVRDPFGALTRDRMLSVLERCNHKGVALDESRGGAGLGLWRVFSTASTIAITVIPGRLTDILVWVDPNRRKSTKVVALAPGGAPSAFGGLNAVHLFFPEDYVLDGALGRFAADHDHDLIDDSFTALLS